MVAPLIGITTSVTVDRTPERAYVNGTYIRAVQAAGANTVAPFRWMTSMAR